MNAKKPGRQPSLRWWPAPHFTSVLLVFALVLYGAVLVPAGTAAADSGLPAVQGDIEKLRNLICDSTYVELGADSLALVALPRQFCDDACRCFDAETLEASSETSCRDTHNQEERISQPDTLFRVADRLLNTADGVQRFTSCDSPDGHLELTRRQAANCIRVMEEVLGDPIFHSCED